MARLSNAGPEPIQPSSNRGSEQPSSIAETPEADLPPFFNTTFSTHRVSPLYIGPRQLDTARLDELAGRLRDTLVGDVVRGVQISLEATETPVGQVGPLRAVQIQWFRAGDVLGDEAPKPMPRGARKGKQRAGRSDTVSDASQQGLWIHVRHENAAYNALLLPSAGKEGPTTKATGWAVQPLGTNGRTRPDEKHFIHLPLLLLRMPQALKGVISEWLATNFDCRVGRVVLGTRTLVNVWEAWVRDMGLSSKGPDFVVTLAFHLPAEARVDQAGSDSEDDLNKEEEDEEAHPAEPGLRSIDVTINPQDLRRFVRAGASLPPARKPTTTPSWTSDPRERRRLAGGNTDDGWTWRSADDFSPAEEQPFTEALGRYLAHHLALDMFHPGVRIVQISCGGFVLAQSRLKIVRIGGDEVGEELSRAAWMFVTQLGERVAGQALPAIFAPSAT